MKPTDQLYINPVQLIDKPGSIKNVLGDIGEEGRSIRIKCYWFYAINCRPNASPLQRTQLSMKIITPTPSPSTNNSD